LISFLQMTDWTLAFFVLATDYTDFHGKIERIKQKICEISAICG